MKWHRATAITVIAYLLSGLPVTAQKYDIDTYPSEGRTLWHQALSGNNSEVLAIINNRPFVFDTSETFKSEQRQAEQILREALAVSKHYENQLPRDLVDCLCNLGSFCYISGETQDADNWFSEAVAVADRHIVKESTAMAAVLDVAGSAARAANEYEKAEAWYVRALNIRRHVLGMGHPDVSYSLMNLSCLCLDRAKSENSTYEHQALKLQSDIDSLTHPRFYINTGDWRMRYTPGLIPPAFNAWGLPYDHDLSHELPRPVHPCLTVNHGTATLPDMVAFAKSIIDKHKNVEIKPQQPQRPVEHGLATIVGRWTVPSDIVPEEIVKVQQSSEEKVEGKFDTTKTRRETVSPIENIPIYVVRQSNQAKIWGAISSYASTKGLSMAEFCGNGENRWPATLKQADAVRKVADSVVESAAVKTAKTDKNGDYEIAGIPKGTYFLYASLATSRHAMMWMLPNDRAITVARVCQLKYSFPEEQASILYDVNLEATRESSSSVINPRRSNRSSEGP